MMTTLVATLGLLPAATSHGIGSDSQRPFAIVIVGGLMGGADDEYLPVAYALCLVRARYGRAAATRDGVRRVMKSLPLHSLRTSVGDVPGFPMRSVSMVVSSPRVWILCFLCAMLASACTAWAQAAPPAPLTLQQVVSLARDEKPDPARRTANPAFSQGAGNSGWTSGKSIPHGSRHRRHAFGY